MLYYEAAIRRECRQRACFTADSTYANNPEEARQHIDTLNNTL
jgi:hypothetical protein